MISKHKKRAVAFSAGGMSAAEQDIGLSEEARLTDQAVRGKREKSLAQNMGLAAFLFGMITAALTLSADRKSVV